jgi:hypothetical protein
VLQQPEKEQAATTRVKAVEAEGRVARVPGMKSENHH